MNKIGYISVDYYPVGTRISNWIVKLDGEPIAKTVIRAHDIEGWYEWDGSEYMEFDDGIKRKVKKIVHEKADITITYTGDNPEYAKFKSS